MSETSETKPLPKLLRVEQVCGGWLKKYLLTYELPSGKEYSYEAVSRKDYDDYLTELSANATNPAHTKAPDAVCIVPRTRDNRLILIKEFRYPLNSYCIAFPAGLIDEGESIETAIARELSEETGYALALNEDGKPHITMLSQPGYSSAGMSGESVQIAYAHVENEPAVAQHTESNEFIEVFSVPVPEVGAFLEENTIPIGTRSQLILETFGHYKKHYEG